LFYWSTWRSAEGSVVFSIVLISLGCFSLVTLLPYRSQVTLLYLQPRTVWRHADIRPDCTVKCPARCWTT